MWSREQWRAYLGTAGIVAWTLEWLSTKLPDSVIATSAHTAERLTQRIPRVPLIVAAGGVDLDLALRTQPADEIVDLVSVGRLMAHKRLDLLLDSVALLAAREQPITCRIIGDGTERPALQRQAQRLGIEHLVQFLMGGVGDDELLSLVKAGRVFVFPSEREGFGIAALEAIACGIPVNHALGRAQPCPPPGPALNPWRGVRADRAGAGSRGRLRAGARPGPRTRRHAVPRPMGPRVRLGHARGQYRGGAEPRSAANRAAVLGVLRSTDSEWRRRRRRERRRGCSTC